MFALEITFQDGVSPSEMLFMRRPQALIGASDYAHVVLEDMKSLGFQLRLVRDLGRKFCCRSTSAADGVRVPPEMDRSYDTEASFSLQGVRLHVFALDSDMVVKDGEPPDKAGVRILRRACSSQSPFFPAVVVHGNPPMVVSFSPDQPLFVGRGKQCALRLEAADVSSKHARLGYENGDFWIEDLGSTNGSYVHQQQISGRTNIGAGTPVVLGREVTLTGVTSEDQIVRASDVKPDRAHLRNDPNSAYPVLFSLSESARPARVVISQGSNITIGRDPSCEMWLGAPHVSRRHCTVSLSRDNRLIVTDTSTNGTSYDEGLLTKGEVLEVGVTPRVLDFGGAVTVAICFNKEEERRFVAAHGSQTTFTGDASRIDQEPERLQDEEEEEIEVSYHAENPELVYGTVPQGLLRQIVSQYRGRSFAGRLAALSALGIAAAIIFVLAALLTGVVSKGL